MKRKILLLEDDPSLGATLAERLNKTDYDTTWVDRIEKAQNEVKEKTFDLIILDVSLPDGSGYSFAKSLNKKYNTPFLFVTAQANAENRLQGYELGAVEYIPKPFHLREFMLRVDHVLSSHSRPQELHLKDVTLDFSTMSIIRADGFKERLSSRDFKLLNLLIEKSPHIVSRDEILNSLWGEDRFPSNRTIDNAIVRLRQSMGKNSNHIIVSIRGVGYQWNPEGDQHE
ncbi:MAG: response regulator transcription factor [Bdellovibrionales bacterium]|nr:response regulator transcription factor [Bdellovibrionales bacterium]